MSSFSGTPRLIKGGIVVLNPDTGAVQRVIPLQYNPDSLTRTLQVQAIGGEGGSRSDALRIKAPAVETFKLDAELDVTDQLEYPEQNRNATEHGLQPQLAALEILVYPTSAQLQTNNVLAHLGTLEILPMEAPFTLFVWSKNRILPVRITEFSITEEAFDPDLNPIRAKVSLGMRVLSVEDLGFDHKGGSLFMSYLQNKEQLAGKMRAGSLSEIGITRIP